MTVPSNAHHLIDPGVLVLPAGTPFSEALETMRLALERTAAGAKGGA